VSNRSSYVLILAFLIPVFAGTTPASASSLIASEEVISKQPAQLTLQGIQEEHVHDENGRDVLVDGEQGSLIEIWFVRDYNSVLAPSFLLPKDEPIASWRVLPDRRGIYSFSFAFWDAGEYEVRVEGEAFTVKVAPLEEEASVTLAIYLGLALFGLVAGALGGRSRGRRRLVAAGAVLPLLVIGGLLVLGPATVWGHGDEPGGISTFELVTSDVQGEVSDDALSFPLEFSTKGELKAGESVELHLIADDDEVMTTTIDHVEDGLTLFRGAVLPTESEVDVTMVFPEGSEYLIQRGFRNATFEVEPVQASGLVQAVSFATFFLAFLLPLLIGYYTGRWVGSRNDGSDAT